jgi:hypothetical protein
MRAGVDFDTLLGGRIEQGVNQALAKIEESAWPKWMGPEKAARYLDCSEKSLGNARRAGKIVGHFYGGEFHYAKAELDAYARSCRKT